MLTGIKDKIFSVNDEKEFNKLSLEIFFYQIREVYLSVGAQDAEEHVVAHGQPHGLERQGAPVIHAIVEEVVGGRLTWRRPSLGNDGIVAVLHQLQ